MPAGIGYDYDGDGVIDPGSDPLEGLGTGGVADPLLMQKLRSQGAATAFGGGAGAGAVPPPPGVQPPGGGLGPDVSGGIGALRGMQQPGGDAGGDGALADVMGYLRMLFGGGQ